MRRAFALVWLIVLAGTAASQPSLRLVLLPFADRAGFQGRWDLSRDVPLLLGRYLSGYPGIYVVPMDSVEQVLEKEDVEGEEEFLRRASEVGARLSADVVIAGKVEAFGVRRFMAGDPGLVGYKSYRSRVELTDVQVVRVGSGREVGTFSVVRDSVERPFDLDLFGRPRRQDREFRELFQVDIGSERFYELPFGRLVDGAFDELSGRIVRALRERPPIDLSGGRAVVLAVEEGSVYLGIGSEDRVEIGDRLPLYREGTSLAVVEVRQIIGSHLCKARIVEGGNGVSAGDRIGQRLTGETDETDR